MTFSVTDVLDDGIERVLDRRLLPVFLALYAVHLALVVATQSYLERQREALAADPFVGEALLPDQFPLALDVSATLAWVVWGLALAGFVTASVVAFRALLAREDGPSSDPPSRHGLLLATAHGFVAAVVGVLVVATGLVLLVLPGLFLASAFAFTHAYISLERVDTVEAMRRSYAATDGYRLDVFVVLAVTVLTYLGVSFLGGFALAFSALLAAPVAGELLNVAFNAFAWLAALAILASAFDHLETARADAAEKWAGIDDELLP
ncbi:hypothetical protein [Natronobiforma cellulositropha]|uniref:hypothetical protein n=1 Tax=Natronobiforma cellulositropha TaxID=1679076 RepID=UPI0021D56CBC|nr:hypothetical protein [Natronobiforma cellulositropha]